MSTRGERKIGLTVSFGLTLISKWLPFNVFTVNFIAGFSGRTEIFGISGENEDEREKKRAKDGSRNPNAGFQGKEVEEEKT